MKIRRKMLKVKGERDTLLTQIRITRLRGKKTRNLAPADPEAKKRRKTNTSQRRAINLKAAAKAEKKAGGLKAETSRTSIEEVAPGARTRTTREKKSLILITANIKTKAMTVRKSPERRPRVETGREVGLRPKTRREPWKMDADLKA